MSIDFDKLDPPAKTSSGVLSLLWRKICLEHKDYLDVLVDRYVVDNDIAAGRVKNIKRKTKSTIISNVTATEMTFKTFIDLVFNFLKCKKLTISIKLTYQSGRESLHSIVVDGVNIEKVNDAKKAVEEAIKEDKDGGS